MTREYHQYCRNCAKKIVDLLDDYEKITIKRKSYAYGECLGCYGPIHCEINVILQDDKLIFTSKKLRKGLYMRYSSV